MLHAWELLVSLCRLAFIAAPIMESAGLLLIPFLILKQWRLAEILRCIAVNSRPLSDFGITSTAYLQNTPVDFTLSPVPSTGAFDISLPAEAAALYIYNEQGAQVYSHKLSEINIRNHSIHINLTTLPGGIYTVN